MTVTSFADFALIEPLQQALQVEQHFTPTPIQAAAIPHLLEGKDVLGTAQTGTGKTAAFALPILQKFGEKSQKSRPHSPRALILAPTRELALQIAKRFAAYGRQLKLRIACVFGGVPQTPQIKVLSRGVHVLIATPGRLLDLQGQGAIRLDQLEVFVLDEVDRMLDLGFQPALMQILALLPERRQSVFFSATMPPPAEALANQLLQAPVRIAVDPEEKTVAAIQQRVMILDKRYRRALLCRLLKSEIKGQVLVFVRTREGAQELADDLQTGGFQAAAIHADKAQVTRQRILDRFREGKLQILCATDVAARGLDVPGIAYVVNYELPQDPQVYVHRIGRTGRAGADGVAISFCGRKDLDLLRSIEREIGAKIPVDETHPFVAPEEPRAPAPTQRRVISPHQPPPAPRRPRR